MVSLPLAAMVAAGNLMMVGTATIYGSTAKTSDVSAITDCERTVLYEKVPCHLSFKRIEATDGEHLAEQKLSGVLFVAPDVSVPPGSRIVVEQQGQVYEMHRSGTVAMYTAHQEIVVELETRHA